MFCVPRLRYNNPGEKCPLCFSLLENPNRPYISLHLIVLQPRFHHQCYPNVIHMSSTNLTVSFCIVFHPLQRITTISTTVGAGQRHDDSDLQRILLEGCPVAVQCSAWIILVQK